MCRAELGPWGQTNEWERVHVLDKLGVLEESDMQRNEYRWCKYAGQRRERLHLAGTIGQASPKERNSKLGFYEARSFDSEGSENKDIQILSYTSVCSLDPF